MSSDPKKRVQAIAQRPENQHCADCGVKLMTSSVWASSTLGVFLCINCSGRHRNLGTHITFVRSVGLDSWTEEQANVMDSIGNVVSNQYWEANLPKDYPRPATEDLDGLTKFVRFKYELAKWADKNTKAPHLLLKEGQKPKKAKINVKNSQSAQLSNPPSENTVPRSNSTSLIDFNTPSHPQPPSSGSVDLLFGNPVFANPPSPPIQPTNSTTFPPPSSGQRSQPPPTFDPFSNLASQPPKPNDTRQALKSLLETTPTQNSQSSSTNVFRQNTPPTNPNPFGNQSFGNPGFTNQPRPQPMRGAPQAPKSNARDAFSGLSPF